MAGAKGRKDAAEKHVIVLHGIGMSKSWMSGLSRALKKAGYTVHNISYPSREKDFDLLVRDHIAPLMEKIPAEKVDFVGHSMGGILIRFYAKEYGSKRIGRVVMIGTPNHGSQVADYLHQWSAFRWFYGTALQGLGTLPENAHEKLPPVDFECGVIAGENHWLHFPINYLADVPMPNDGLVTVDSTRIEGMTDHTVLNADHSLMVWTPEVWRRAIAFLQDGRFPAPEDK
ncbi:MAG: alpha/beta fold hydrolase [Alphaproteobacteria bacterium]|nr:alpha/beta fold hydrolase [Alphaproteobacteria bacterium]